VAGSLSTAASSARVSSWRMSSAARSASIGEMRSATSSVGTERCCDRSTASASRRAVVASQPGRHAASWMRSACRKSSTQVRCTASSTSASLRSTARADERRRPSYRRTVSSQAVASPQERATRRDRSVVAGASVLQVRDIGGSFGDPCWERPKPPVGEGVPTSVGRRIRAVQKYVRRTLRRTPPGGCPAPVGGRDP
jgi:hypothetical protein